MHRLILCLALAGPLASGVAAQDAPPSGLVEMELERSRACVDVLARLDQLDADLAPLAQRSQRLLAIGEAISLEDDRVVETLDSNDAIESQVADWFVADAELAQRYVATLAPAINDERSAAREAILTAVQEALTAVQAEANTQIEATGDLSSMAAPCDGAILVRPAVLEMCAESTSSLCEEAAMTPSEVTRFRFVDTPEAVWEVQEVRPWTDPTPLFPTQDGQLEGARTVGYVRTGNVVLTVGFSPLLSDRAELSEAEASRIAAVNETLGIQIEHPDIAATPALSVRATLPDPLADESTYVLHFGAPDDADILWTGDAGTGAPLEAAIAMSPNQLQRLSAGDALTLSALRELGPDQAEAVFTIEMSVVNQARATQALLGYMAQQLGSDLAQIVPPRGDD